MQKEIERERERERAVIFDGKFDSIGKTDTSTRHIESTNAKQVNVSKLK